MKISLTYVTFCCKHNSGLKNSIKLYKTLLANIPSMRSFSEKPRYCTVYSSFIICSVQTVKFNVISKSNHR